jgi:hypothetical protein
MGVRYGETAEVHSRKQDPDYQNEPPSPVRRVKVLQRLDDHARRLGRRGGLAPW